MAQRRSVCVYSTGASERQEEEVFILRTGASREESLPIRRLDALLTAQLTELISYFETSKVIYSLGNSISHRRKEKGHFTTNAE